MKLVPCRGCGKPIVFGTVVRDGRKRFVPLDVNRHAYRLVEDADSPIVQKLPTPDPVVLTSHFLTCPEANRFSGGKR